MWWECESIFWSRHTFMDDGTLAILLVSCLRWQWENHRKSFDLPLSSCLTTFSFNDIDLNSFMWVSQRLICLELNNLSVVSSSNWACPKLEYQQEPWLIIASPIIWWPRIKDAFSKFVRTHGTRIHNNYCSKLIDPSLFLSMYYKYV